MLSLVIVSVLFLEAVLVTIRAIIVLVLVMVGRAGQQYKGWEPVWPAESKVTFAGHAGQRFRPDCKPAARAST